MTYRKKFDVWKVGNDVFAIHITDVLTVSGIKLTNPNNDGIIHSIIFENDHEIWKLFKDMTKQWFYAYIMFIDSITSPLVVDDIHNAQLIVEGKQIAYSRFYTYNYNDTCSPKLLRIG